MLGLYFQSYYLLHGLALPLHKTRLPLSTGHYLSSSKGATASLLPLWTSLSRGAPSGYANLLRHGKASFLDCFPWGTRCTNPSSPGNRDPFRDVTTVTSVTSGNYYNTSCRDARIHVLALLLQAHGLLPLASLPQGRLGDPRSSATSPSVPLGGAPGTAALPCPASTFVSSLCSTYCLYAPLHPALHSHVLFPHPVHVGFMASCYDLTQCRVVSPTVFTCNSNTLLLRHPCCLHRHQLFIVVYLPHHVQHLTATVLNTTVPPSPKSLHKGGLGYLVLLLAGTLLPAVWWFVLPVA